MRQVREEAFFRARDFEGRDDRGSRSNCGSSKVHEVSTLPGIREIGGLGELLSLHAHRLSPR